LSSRPKRAPDSHGIVCQSLLDVRVRPDHRSEMSSQLLLGEVVRRLGRDRSGGWWRVENRADGYRGWVRAWGLRVADADEADRWERHAKARIRRVFVAVRTRPRGGELLARLWWNSRVVAGPKSAGAVPLMLPDGVAGWVRADEVGVGMRDVPSITDRVLDLLGTPYLWGGRSPAGFDCSGFVQMLHAERGRSLPRDASDQHRTTSPVYGLKRARIGDLVFFKGSPRSVSHVGVWVGGGLFAHARGTVALSSLDPRSSLYDKDLAAQFSGVGRPPLRPGGRA